MPHKPLTRIDRGKQHNIDWSFGGKLGTLAFKVQILEVVYDVDSWRLIRPNFDLDLVYL